MMVQGAGLSIVVAQALVKSLVDNVTMGSTVYSRMSSDQVCAEWTGVTEDYAGVRMCMEASIVFAQTCYLSGSRRLRNTFDRHLAQEGTSSDLACASKEKSNWRRRRSQPAE